MREIVHIAIDEILPEPSTVLLKLDVPRRAHNGTRTAALVGDAITILSREAAPRGIFQRTTVEEFAEIYRGDGRNPPDTPLERLVPLASDLALYAATLGPAVGSRIAELFARCDFALATILDAAASEAAEKAGESVRAAFGRERSSDGKGVALTYSPGYCGWDVTGQKALFTALRPREIGIALNDSCLMQPLKSVSGVIVSGPSRIHVFEDDYPFCSWCIAHTCRERIRLVESRSVETQQGRKECRS